MFDLKGFWPITVPAKWYRVDEMEKSIFRNSTKAKIYTHTLTLTILDQ